ncbi:DUF2993 domain-containing protein [Streptomyces xiaopingdaonensis]|uniref:LmeA family phospholipid-binding protein n=1 Tax=Streptomyces xiaopingdaonensis TaxID=1565415 RepID=UPI0002F08066|nr:DUF2993 domain-containing protein [Streptomyces xiaopingdaonensis]
MRALRIVLVVLVVLAGLAVGADRLAVNLAEDEAADKVREQIEGHESVEGNVDTSVSINGFPFLTQLASREFGDVEFGLKGLTTGTDDRKITISKVDVHGEQVRTNSDYSEVTADRARGEALIKYDDLSSAAGDGTSVAWAGKDDPEKVKITKKVPVVGSVTVISSATIKGKHTVRLNADEIKGEGPLGMAKGVLDRLVRDRIDDDWDFDALPSELKLEEARPTEEGIVVTLSGKDVKFTG